LDRRVFVGAVLTLLSLSIFCSLNIMPAKAVDTIYVRSDGSIDPPTAPIQRNGDLYTLTDNINTDADPGIKIERDNIVFDGSGFTIEGTGSVLSHGIYLNWRSNVTIQNTHFRNWYFCIYLIYSSFNTVCGNDIADSIHGVYDSSSSNNLINGNNMGNTTCGVWLGSCSDSCITQNNMTASDQLGIRIEKSSNISITENTIVDMPTTHAAYAISLLSTLDCKVIRNSLRRDGTGLHFQWANETIIVENELTGHIRGLSLTECSNNYFVHNSFIDNKEYDIKNSTILWNANYPSGGNYWSNYPGADLFVGPYQNVSGSDGIGDTPYIIDADNQDNYPLMNAWIPTGTSVRIGSQEYPVTIVSNTTLDQILTARNILRFISSGPSGETGYCNVIFPTVNTTDIKVFIDGEKLTPPPFPVINSNGTHYFIYFEYTLSTHQIYIQFASEVPVGGNWIPTGNLQLLTFLASLSATVAVGASFVGIRRIRKRQD
jgi:parallel beta-helix repeat protein